MSSDNNKEDKPAAEFGATLREVRDSLGISLRKAAKAAGISAAYLSQMELGNIRDPSPRVLHELAKVYADLAGQTTSETYARLMDKADYIVPTRSPESTGAAITEVVVNRYQDDADRWLNVWLSLTPDEKDALLEYLDWYRWRRRVEQERSGGTSE